MSEKMSGQSDSWSRCLGIVRESVEPKAFRAYFEPLRVVEFSANIVRLRVPSEYICEQIDGNYATIFADALRSVLGRVPEVYYETPVESSTDNPTVRGGESPRADSLATTVKAGAEGSDERGGVGVISLEPKSGAVKVPVAEEIKNPFNTHVTTLSIEPRLNPEYTMSNFVVGDCNRLVYNAGMAIANEPGRLFNPLFVYGRSGVGKTHLVNGIGAEVCKRHPQKSVLYLSAELFMQQFVNATKRDEINDFIHFYELIDVLILDDVQNLSGRSGTQNTFFHIFNHLHQTGRQIIMTCDKEPDDLVGIEERLLSRFKWSLVAKMDVPDFETLCSITRAKALRYGMELTDEVISIIAHRVNRDVRELEGLLTKLMAYSIYMKSELSQEEVEKLLGAMPKFEMRRVMSVDEVCKEVCDYSGVSIEDVKRNTRLHEVVVARQLAMYFAKRYTGESLSRIGVLLGGKNHATVLYSCNAVESMMKSDAAFKARVEELARRLQKR